MKNTIGLIGPEDSVNLILDIANEFSDSIHQIPFIYTKVEDTVDIIQNNRHLVDVWIFSGQAPFAVAKDHLVSKNGFYPQLSGASLTKVLLEISYVDKRSLSKLSFDTIPSKGVYETFAELGLSADKLKLYPYSGYKPTDELFHYHYNLYKDNVVEACITGIRSVYEKLQQANVPAYRIIPTRTTIRDTVLMASQRSEIIQFKGSQISTLILQIYDMNKLIGKENLSFDTHRLSLKIQELVIEFTEKIQGSFILQGNDKVVIHSTRGALDVPHNDDIFILLQKVTMLTNLSANIGIGYGYTVLGAEQNAYLALNYANTNGQNNVMLADEKGIIEGPLQDQKSLQFSRRTNDKEVIERLKLSGISIHTFNKVISVQENMGQNFVSAYELSKWSGMTQRNARRILNELEKQGLAKIVGAETPGARGRPRRLFCVGLESERT